MSKYNPKGEDNGGVSMEEKFIPEDGVIPIRTHSSDKHGHGLQVRFTIPKNWHGLATRLRELYPEAKSEQDMDRIIYYRGMIYCYRDRKNWEAAKRVRPALVLLLAFHDYMDDLDLLQSFKGTVNRAKQFINEGKTDDLDYINSEVAPVLEYFKTDKVRREAENYMKTKLLYPLRKVKG
jgi:hypothetical protein